MSDIGFWLTKKYAIMANQAAAAARLSDAQASHVNAETAEVAPNAKATRTQAYGAADAAFGAGAASRAHAGLLATNATLAPSLANAEIGQRNAQAGMLNSEAAKNNYLISPAHRELITQYLARTTPGGLSAFGTKLPAPSATPGVVPGATAAPGSPGTLPGDTSLLPTPSTGGPLHRAPAAVGGGPGASLISTGSPAAGNGSNPDDLWHQVPGFAAGCGMVPAHVPGHASGVNDITGHVTSSVGGRIAQDGVSMGSPGFGAVGKPNGYGSGMVDMSSGLPAVQDPGIRGSANGPIPGFAAGDSVVDPGQENPVAPENYRRGTGKVAGKGDGKTDKTLSMLAPGEAVLNRAAAEDLGRDTIDALNAAGAEKMGLKQQPNQAAEVPVSQAKVPGHKGGTSNVGKPSAKKGAVQAAPGDKAPAKGGKEPAQAKPKNPSKADGKSADGGVKDGGGKPAPKKGAPAPAASVGHAPSGVHPAAPAMLAALSRMLAGGGQGPGPIGPAMGPPGGGAPLAAGMPQPQARGMM